MNCKILTHSWLSASRATERFLLAVGMNKGVNPVGHYLGLIYGPFISHYFKLCGRHDRGRLSGGKQSAPHGVSLKCCSHLREVGSNVHGRSTGKVKRRLHALAVWLKGKNWGLSTLEQVGLYVLSHHESFFARSELTLQVQHFIGLPSRKSDSPSSATLNW